MGIQFGPDVTQRFLDDNGLGTSRTTLQVDVNEALTWPYDWPCL